jgi:hypothetical protein
LRLVWLARTVWDVVVVPIWGETLGHWPRTRPMAAACALAVVALTGLAAPAASAATHRAPRVFLSLRVDRFTIARGAAAGYTVDLRAFRDMSQGDYGLGVLLRKSVDGPTTGETATERHLFDFDVAGGVFKATSDLALGQLHTIDGLGSYGRIKFRLTGAGPERITTSCRGYVQRSTRAVAVTGPMGLRPDAAGSVFFGSIPDPGDLTGRLARTTISPHRGGCHRRRHPRAPFCPTGQTLVSSTASGDELLGAGAFTDPATNVTTGLLEGLSIGPGSDSVISMHDLTVRTPDTSWLSVSGDLSRGSVDAGALGVGWVSGSANYGWDAAKGTQTEAFPCGGSSLDATASIGALDSPVTVSFDGASSFRTPTSKDSAMAESIAAGSSVARSSAARSVFQRMARWFGPLGGLRLGY